MKHRISLPILGLVIIFIGTILFLKLRICGHLSVKTSLELALGVANFWSAFILGLSAYRQAKYSNELSDRLFRKEVNCNLIPQSEVTFTLETIEDIQNIIRFATLHETEGLYCCASNLPNKDDREKRYIKIVLKFCKIGDLVEDCVVQGVYLNQSFKKENKLLKPYYVKFKILNPLNKVFFRYNPIDKAYYLEVYIKYSPNLMEINNNGYFVFDLMLEMTNSYNMAQSIIYSFNFVKIEKLDNLLNGKIKQITIQLDNVTIHKNKSRSRKNG